MQIAFKGQIKKDCGWECFRWDCTLNGVDIDYFTGLGHATKNRRISLNGYPSGAGKKPKSLLDKGAIRDDENNQWIHKPEMDDILHALFLDAQCAELSFRDFCDDFGYDFNSRKALEIHFNCDVSREKLRKALGADYNKEKERIEALEL